MGQSSRLTREGKSIPVQRSIRPSFTKTPKLGCSGEPLNRSRKSTAVAFRRAVQCRTDATPELSLEQLNISFSSQVPSCTRPPVLLFCIISSSDPDLPSIDRMSIELVVCTLIAIGKQNGCSPFDAGRQYGQTTKYDAGAFIRSKNHTEDHPLVRRCPITTSRNHTDSFTDMPLITLL